MNSGIVFRAAVDRNVDIGNDGFKRWRKWTESIAGAVHSLCSKDEFQRLK